MATFAHKLAAARRRMPEYQRCPRKYKTAEWLLPRLEKAKRKTRPNQKHGIYAIRCEDYVKFGITTSDINSRLSSLQVSSPYPLHLVCLVSGDRFLEKRIHEYLAPENQSGEWFRIGERTQSVLNALGVLDFFAEVA